MLLYFSKSWAALPRWRLSWRLPGCPPRFRPPPCPPRPRLRPPCRLLIKCLRPYAVSYGPFASGRQGDANAPALTLSFRSHALARSERPIVSGLGQERSSADLERARPRTPDVVARMLNAK